LITPARAGMLEAMRPAGIAATDGEQRHDVLLVRLDVA
jgi:hypothetical protein